MEGNVDRQYDAFLIHLVLSLFSVSYLSFQSPFRGARCGAQKSARFFVLVVLASIIVQLLLAAHVSGWFEPALETSVVPSSLDNPCAERKEKRSAHLSSPSPSRFCLILSRARSSPSFWYATHSPRRCIYVLKLLYSTIHSHSIARLLFFDIFWV
jgi:hypothetical protein